MIRSITQEQFRKYFTPVRGPEGALLSRIQQQCVETRWYQDDETNRVGVVIYDSRDDDWQAVTLEDLGSGYETHEVEINLPSEREAIDALMALFSRETGETRQLVDRMARLLVENTGRTPEEALLATPKTL